VEYSLRTPSTVEKIRRARKPRKSAAECSFEGTRGLQLFRNACRVNRDVIIHRSVATRQTCRAMRGGQLDPLSRPR